MERAVTASGSESHGDPKVEGPGGVYERCAWCGGTGWQGYYDDHFWSEQWLSLDQWVQRLLGAAHGPSLAKLLLDREGGLAAEDQRRIELQCAAFEAWSFVEAARSVDEHGMSPDQAASFLILVAVRLSARYASAVDDVLPWLSERYAEYAEAWELPLPPRGPLNKVGYLCHLFEGHVGALLSSFSLVGAEGAAAAHMASFMPGSKKVWEAICSLHPHPFYDRCVACWPDGIVGVLAPGRQCSTCKGTGRDPDWGPGLVGEPGRFSKFLLPWLRPRSLPRTRRECPRCHGSGWAR